jgi:2-oxoglutarate ferredoxin oxidoreductase subunit alpha
LKEILAGFKKIVVCELNDGQLADYLRMNFQEFKYEQMNKLQGQPFTTVELEAKFNTLIEK